MPSARISITRCGSSSACCVKRVLLDNTIIAVTADHGEMLGNHRQFAKGMFYEESAKIPFIIIPTAEYAQFGSYMTDERLVELRDMMPTLLDMAGIPIPDTVEGMSLVSPERPPRLPVRRALRETRKPHA